MDSRSHNIVVCCDGSWGESGPGSRTNIQVLADAFASADPTTPVQAQAGVLLHNDRTNTDVCYFNGGCTSGAEGDVQPGALGGFCDLLMCCANGAVAAGLPDRCKEAYRFIAEHYKGPNVSRVWLFGLDKGAYAVRAVAGMINNAGIIRAEGLDDAGDQPMDQDIDDREDPESRMVRLVQRVWDMYNSDEEACHPIGQEAVTFRSNHRMVWPHGVQPPIVFMGLLDTVGAGGLPRIDELGLPTKRLTHGYRPFRDCVVSSEVQHVFHACSTHDRLAPFEPCFVRRREMHPMGLEGVLSQPPKYGVHFNTEEVWYPGAHYDLGRQRYVLSNQPMKHALSSVLSIFRDVSFTAELADYPLVGYELDGTLDPPAAAGNYKDYPPCIVGKVCSIDMRMLPAPQDRQVWQQLVAGPRPGSSILDVSVAGSVRQDLREVGVLRTAAQETMRLTRSALSWSYKLWPTALGRQRVSNFMWPSSAPYTIDAETRILEWPARLVGYATTGRLTPDIILRDRSIPMPVDKDWFRIGDAKFFPVPSDVPGSFASYMPYGRRGEPWHMSKTYKKYNQDLATYYKEPSASRSRPPSRARGTVGGGVTPEKKFSPGKDQGAIAQDQDAISSRPASRTQQTIPRRPALQQLLETTITQLAVADYSDAHLLDARSCSTLQSLKLSRFSALEKLVGSPALKELVVTDCSQLQSVTIPVEAMSTLNLLDLSGCSALQSLPPGLSGIGKPALQRLVLHGCRSLKQLPDTLDSLALLTELELNDCTALERLPESVGNLMHLQLLDLTGCSNLQCLPDTVESLMELEQLRLKGCTKVEPPFAIGRGTARLDDGPLLPARFYTCETDEPSAADIAAHLQKQRPQLVLIQEQHCQAADLQETLAKAGYFQLLKADTGSIFAADDVLVGLEGAISGQASNTQLIGRDSAAGSSSGSSSSWDRSVIEGQQAGGKQQRNVRIRLSGGSGQGSGSGAGGGSSGGGSGNGGGGGQHGSGPPSPDDGGSSSGGDQAGSSQGNAGSAVTGAHAACQSADCGRLKLQLSKKVCASSHGQGSASIDNLVDGSTDLRTLRFTGVFDEGSKGLTGSAAWKLKDWPRLPLAPQAPSQGQQSTQHEFFVDLAVNMCRHENQVCLKIHQARAQHTVQNEEKCSVVSCLGLPLLRSSFALVGRMGGSNGAGDTGPPRDTASDTTMVVLKKCNIPQPLCIEKADPPQSKINPEKIWLFGVEPEVAMGKDNVSVKGLKANQSLLPEIKAIVDANVPQQLVMMHPVAPQPVYPSSRVCGRATMELRRSLLKTVLCSELQDKLCYLDYNAIQTDLTVLTYIAELSEDFDSSSLQLHVDICLPSVLVRVKNPYALGNSRIFGINLDNGAAVYLLEGRCQLKVAPK